MNQQLLFKDQEITKKNLLARFEYLTEKHNHDARLLVGEQETVAGIIAMYLDTWRQVHQAQMKASDLADMISDMRYNGVKHYVKLHVDELLTMFWDEVVENTEHVRMDDFCNEYLE